MWQQIQANRRRSVVLIVLMGGALLLVGTVAGEALIPGGGYLFGMLLAGIIWLTQLGLYFGAPQSVLLAGLGARELKKEDSPRLFNIVEEMVIASGLGYQPRVLLIDDPAPNAFAIGRTPNNSAVAVTSGLMHRLNRDELQGVIAHEIAHLKNEDVKFMTLAAVMLGSIVLLSELTLRMVLYGGRAGSRSRSRGGGGHPAILLVALLVAILGPLFAQLLYFACSRKREYLADACAAQYTRYPLGLASALEKIALAARSTALTSKTLAPLFIVNPLAASGRSASLFSTHPPTEERIRILRSMAGAGLADYEAAYRRAKGGSLIPATELSPTPTQPMREPLPDEPIESTNSTRTIKYRRNGYIPITCSCGLQFSVPATYERDHVNCIRCGSVLPLPAAAPSVPPVSAPTGTKPSPVPPSHRLQYQRRTRGWENFRCACGHVIELSPAFSAPQLRCPKCARTIEIR